MLAILISSALATVPAPATQARATPPAPPASVQAARPAPAPPLFERTRDDKDQP
jgi:hypothetical protein